MVMVLKRGFLNFIIILLKRIPTTLIAAASLQDVSVIICFGICSSIALNDIKKDSDSLGKVIFKIAYEVNL